MTTINCVDFCCASAIQTSLMALGLSEVDLTAIVLAVIGMVSGWVSYWLDHRKHKQEVKNLEAEAQKLKAETRQKYMDLAKMYVDEFTKNIATPLEKRVDELTIEVKELKDELENVKRNACYCAGCPNRISVLG